MSEAEWFELSLAGDLEAAYRAQSATIHSSTHGIREPLKGAYADDLLPLKRIPAAPCPGFERLDAIMSIEPDPEPTILANYVPVWSSAWANAMDQMNEEGLDFDV